jgi:hypothetical protein
MAQPPTSSGALPHAGLAFNIDAPLHTPAALGVVVDPSSGSARALRRILLPDFRVRPRDFGLWQRLRDGSWVTCAPGEAAALEHAHNAFSGAADNDASAGDGAARNDSIRRITIAAARLCHVQVPHAFAVEPFCIAASPADVQRIAKRVQLSLPE